MDLNIFNYKYIIIIIIIIIILLFINTKLIKKETFTGPRDCYSLILYGVLGEKLLNNTTNEKNILIDSSWEFKQSNQDNLGTSKISLNSVDGIISGLDSKKTYQIDVSFDFYNININEKNIWKFEIKKYNLTSADFESYKDDNDNDRPITVYSYQYYDYLLNSFNISTFIKNTDAFSLFMTNMLNVSVLALTKSFDKDVLNSNITVSLLEMI